MEPTPAPVPVVSEGEVPHTDTGRSWNPRYINVIVLIVAVFLSGAYLRGESARKEEVKREMGLIRSRQDEIAAAVAEIHRIATEKDSLLLARIAGARAYIDRLDAKEQLSDQQIAALDREIRTLQGGIDSSLAALQTSAAFRLEPAPVPVAPPGQ